MEIKSVKNWKMKCEKISQEINKEGQTENMREKPEEVWELHWRPKTHLLGSQGEGGKSS